MRTLNRQGAKMVLCLMSLCWQVPIALADTTEEIEARTARLNAEMALAEARYGTPIEGKSGDVTNPGALSGIVQQQAFQLSAKTATELKESLLIHPGAQVCGTVLITDNVDASTRLLKAESIKKKIDDFDAKLPTKSGMQAFLAIPIIPVVAGLLGTANQIAGFVRSDYAIGDLAVTFESNWIIAAMLMNTDCPSDKSCSKLRAEAYPDFDQMRLWTDKLDDLYARALAVQERVEAETQGKEDDKSKKDVADAKAMVTAVAAFRAGLIEPAANGIAPVASISTFVAPGVAIDKQICLARLIIGNAKGTLITKNGIFGKGGKVYAQVPMQLAAIVTSTSGRPISMLCKQTSFASAIKVSRLTKPVSQYADPDWQDPGATTSHSGDCNATVAATDAAHTTRTKVASIEQAPTGTRKIEDGSAED